MDLYGLHSYTIILLFSTLSLVAGSNVDCNGKAFHCVNTTHFKICVDLGGGVSTTVDEFLIPCPRNTACQQYNLFECEFELTTTPPPPTTQSEVTNEQLKTSDNVWKHLDVTTLLPLKQPQGMELSEKYYNALNITPESSTTNFLSNADKNPVSDIINNLLSGSNIDNNKTLNISRSYDKKLTYSATGSGISVTQTSPYNNNLLVTNTENPVSHSTTQDRRSQTDLLKTESFKPLNINRLDLNTRLTVAKRTNEVSGVSELFSVTLLPDNLNKSLQENTSRTTNINKQFDNTSQGRNLDILITYNTNQLNNSDKAQYHSTNSSTYSANTNADINNFESTTSNLFVDRIFSSYNINKNYNVSSVITSDASLQHLEPVNTEIFLGTTKELGASISSNTTDAIETFLNAGLNTNVKENGVIDRAVIDDYITISTSIISEITTVKTNDIANQFTNSGLNYGKYSVALTNPFLEGNNTTLSDKPPTMETKSSKNNTNEILNSIGGNFTTPLNNINISQYLSSTEQYLANAKNDTSTSTSEIITSKNMSEILNLTSKEVSQVNNLSQISIVSTMGNVSADTDAADEIHANLNYFNELGSTKNAKNHSNPSLHVFNNSLITNINMPVLTTVDMATATQVPSFILVNKLISEENPKEYSTTISALSLNTSSFTKVASQSTISNKIVDGVTSTAVNMFQVLGKGDVTAETLGDLTVLDESVTENPNNFSTPSTLIISEQLVLTKNSKNESDLKSSLLINKTEISKSDIISPNYNTKLNVMTNNGSNIVDTLPTLTTEIIFSSDHSTIFKGRTTDEYKSNTKESYVLKENKNITWTEPVIVTVATDLAASKIVINTELDSNVKAEMHNGITTLKPIPHLILKNVTWPVMRTAAIDLENNNITTTKTRNNVTTTFSNGLKSLKSISDSISTTSKIQPTLLELLTATDSFYKENIGTTSTILTNHQSFNESTTGYLTKIPDYILKNKQVDTIDSTILITSTVINDLERDTASITSLPATLDKPTTLTDRISMTFSYSESDNDVTTKSIINSLYRENQLSPISTLINKVSDVHKIRTESFTDSTMVKPLMNTTVSINSMDLTNNTIADIDLLSEHGLDNNKSSENKFTIESTMTANPLTYYNPNITSSKHVTPPGKITATTLYSQFDKQKLNRKQVNYEHTYVDDQKSENSNFNSTERQFGNIQKLITTDNFTSLIDLNIDKTNTSLRDIEGNHNLITNNLVENSVKIDVTNMNNTYLNNTNKNIIVPTTNLPINSNSKSIPLIYSKNLSSTDIYKISENYFTKNFTTINTFSKTSAPNKYNETDHKKLNQTNKYVQAPAHVINSNEHKGNKTEYLLNNPYIQVTPSKDLKDSIFKEISYNDVIIKNITLADKNTAQKNIDDIKSSGFNKNNITNNKPANVKTNRSELTDYNQISEIPNSEHSENAIKPILIVQEPLEEVNHTSLHTESGNLSLIPEYEFKRYVTDSMNNSTINKSNNVNRSKFIAPVKNKTISNNFYEDIINSSGIVNLPLEANTTAPTNTLTYSRNASDIKSIKIIRNKEKYTSESKTTNKWLKNTPSELKSVQNKTHHATSTTAIHFFTIMPSELDRSSVTTETLNILKLTSTIVSNITKFDLNSTQDVIKIFDHSNRSNGNEKKEPRHRQGYSESLPVGKVFTKYKTLQFQKGFNATTDKNFSDSKYTNLITNKEFRCSKRGKYSHPNNCNNFFICIGRVQPIVGVCPTHTVFSKFLKQCTKNITHCIRNNQFKCTAAGRFINILSNNSYFICARNKSGFIRFTLKCQKGHYLNKNNIKCTPELINVSKSDENSSSTKELSTKRYKEMEGLSVSSPNYFECEKEGKFNDPLDCRKYFVCKKGRKAVFRRKIRKCDSDEVFHRKKKKCVDEESYECDI